MNAGDPLEWYFEIPIVSRTYFTVSFLTTAACALEIISPLTLYFNYTLIFEKGQIWRLFTNFMFFGMFSLDFLFHMYFLVRYCRLLEENSFRGRRGDFILFILFGMLMMSLIAPFVNIPFFGSSLTFMMVYIWGRRNEHVRMSFLGLFPFTAPYLPWVLFSFSLILGNSAVVDLIGIAAGHLYFYFDDIYPEVARVRGWAPRHYLRISEYFQNPDIDSIAVDTEPVPAEPVPTQDNQTQENQTQDNQTQENQTQENQTQDNQTQENQTQDNQTQEPEQDRDQIKQENQTPNNNGELQTQDLSSNNEHDEIERRRAAMAAAAANRLARQGDGDDDNIDHNNTIRRREPHNLDTNM